MNTNTPSIGNRSTSALQEYIATTQNMTGPQAAVLAIGCAGLTLVALKALDVVGEAFDKGAILSFDPAAKTWSLQSPAA